MSHPSARPSLIVHSIARSFGTGSAPGCARQTGHVRVFGAPPKPDSQRQNICVRVFGWTWISRPMTGSHSATKQLLRLQRRHLDVAAHLEDRQVLLERAVHAEDAELAFARLERQTHIADLHGARAVEQPGMHTEYTFDRQDEVGRTIDDPSHACSRSDAIRVSGADGRTGKARTS